MIGGYKTHFAGVCEFEGVKTRRMLHAPVSMDFKHTLRSYMTRGFLDLYRLIERTKEPMPEFQTTRYKTRIRLETYDLRFERWLDVHDYELSGSASDIDRLNLKLNKIAYNLAEESKLAAITAVMREYNRRTLYCRTENRERFATATVKMA